MRIVQNETNYDDEETMGYADESTVCVNCTTILRHSVHASTFNNKNNNNNSSHSSNSCSSDDSVCMLAHYMPEHQREFSRSREWRNDTATVVRASEQNYQNETALDFLIKISELTCVKHTTTRATQQHVSFLNATAP